MAAERGSSYAKTSAIEGEIARVSAVSGCGAVRGGHFPMANHETVLQPSETSCTE